MTTEIPQLVEPMKALHASGEALDSALKKAMAGSLSKNELKAAIKQSADARRQIKEAMRKIRALKVR